MPKPCDNCPWRKDAPPGYWDPDHFKSIWNNCQDDGLRLMLCHKSRPDEGVEVPCAGYVVTVGYDSIGLRLAAMQGKVDPREYNAKGIPLYDSFEDMMRAQGIEPPPRNKVRQP